MKREENSITKIKQMKKACGGARWRRNLTRLHLLALAAFALYAILEAQGRTGGGVTEKVAEICLGLVLGTLMTCLLWLKGLLHPCP